MERLKKSMRSFDKGKSPLAKAIPKQRGMATKKTTTLAGRSVLIFLNNSIFFITIIGSKRPLVY